MTAGLVLGLVLAQSATAGPPVPADLQRIRKALEAPARLAPARASTQSGEPVFRVKVEGFELGNAWDDRSIVPAYVRPWFPSYHHDFMQQVTPEQFRGGTLYPQGLPIGALIHYLWKKSKAAHYAAETQRAREEVSRELATFLACRSDSSRPGC